MENSIYKINKGINRSIEFKGLKAQYIWYVGIGVVILIIVYSILYAIGLNQYLLIAIIMALGAAYILKVYQLSNDYGEHGLMKMLAKKRLPKALKCYSRLPFIDLDIRGKRQ